MKMLFALTAAALAVSALSVPASAGTIGCRQGDPITSSAKATNCDSWGSESSAMNQPRAEAGFAYVPTARTIVAPSARYLPDLENEGGRTGVSGGND
jgi:hypothetical protein